MSLLRIKNDITHISKLYKGLPLTHFSKLFKGLPLSKWRKKTSLLLSIFLLIVPFYRHFYTKRCFFVLFFMRFSYFWRVLALHIIFVPVKIFLLFFLLLFLQLPNSVPWDHDVTELLPNKAFQWPISKNHVKSTVSNSNDATVEERMSAQPWSSPKFKLWCHVPICQF